MGRHLGVLRYIPALDVERTAAQRFVPKRPKAALNRRTLKEERTAKARRRARETQRITMPEPAVNTVDRADAAGEVPDIIDQELCRLPEKYRAAVVLCDVEGRPRKEAARQLRIPEGTLSSRLATARQRLARRLSRRGVALSAGALAAALTHSTAVAAPSTALVSATVRTAAL